MTAARAIGTALARLGVRFVFGVVGSGNFHVTNALVAAGARFVAARHEGGAATMADAYSRMSGTVAALTVHQGCGLTNAMTGIAEAAKSRTPMLVLAADVTERRSNFYVDQDALADAVGALVMRVECGDDAVAAAVRAYHLARDDRRTVVLNLPLAVQAAQARQATVSEQPRPAEPQPDGAGLARLVDALTHAQRPVFIAGRGARAAGAREALLELGDACGALVATSAVAKGLFHGSPWSLDVSGGFASPLAAQLIRDADVVVGWGCALNMWTTRHGNLIGPDAAVVQVDLDPDALGAQRPIAFGVVGGVTATARAATMAIGVARTGYRSEQIRAGIQERIRWRAVEYEDTSTPERIDPRTLTIALDDMLPAERVIGVDSGNFMGYPSMFLSVPDEYGFCFTQAFQSIGLGLSTAIGAGLAQPDRLPVAALGDGGALMSIAELDTVRRLGLPMVVIVYNDDAYGAEVHHFGPDGFDLSTVRFPPTDIAAIARGFGFEAVSVSRVDDLTAVRAWLDGARDRPLLVDAKVTADRGSWWLEEAFRGH
ncbi:MAG TPA: thiamine pyrophosphate-binding protein [Jatrophihabitantaceae bacterium]|nr:thiamine pyrophosphate-binding protein [Jatrophihabitantaceae bacterium]